jgi:hypothetical protein
MAKRGRKASAKAEHIKKGRKKGHRKGGHKKHKMVK